MSSQLSPSPVSPHRERRRPSPLALGLLTLLLGLCAGVAAHAQGALPLRPVAARTTVTEFALNDLKGDTFRLSDLRGKVVVVNFWATWCNPCVQELPFLNTYHLDFADQGFVVVAISTDGPQTLSEVRRTVQRRKWKMPILLDTEGAVLANLNPRGQMPYTLYLDREGRLATDHDGYTAGDEQKMKATIEALLAEPVAGAAIAPPAVVPASAAAIAAPIATPSVPASAPASGAASAPASAAASAPAPAAP